MSENKHTMSDLYQMQSLPLSSKIRMTEYRIRQWVETYGEEGCYVSFSGGKDSTVLLDIVWNRCGFNNIPAVFVDVPTQYPELKEFATKFAGDRLTILKPKISFAEVCDKYGFPMISKEVSNNVDGARKYIKLLADRQTDRQTGRIPYAANYRRVCGLGECKRKPTKVGNSSRNETKQPEGEYP